ncbi:hypothetical protein FA13DRAFT_1738972 [Coprinellus micaceus]|uniref:Uncharacterized protein n=1 Tax=Coprinellus micaceus TaxID=71717 RepID=A0A4Y7ST31_COPMI|nr:hypothetical protein FA13DRAFT_1738972 [Coprinellus micaceus]
MVAFFHSALDHPLTSEFLGLRADEKSYAIDLEVDARLPRSVACVVAGRVFRRAPYIGASRLDVESVAIATLMGAALPSWALFAYREPSKTVLWQAFPLYIFVARVGYRTDRPRPFPTCITRTSKTPSPASDSSQPINSNDGYNATRLVLLASSSISTYFHLSFLSTILSHPDAPNLWTCVSPKSPRNVDLVLGSADALSINVLIFLFWDFVFAFVSTFAVLCFDTLRDGEGVMEWFPTLLGCGLGCVVVGPGAMLALCVLGREVRLRHSIGSPLDDRVRHPTSR